MTKEPGSPAKDRLLMVGCGWLGRPYVRPRTNAACR